MAQATPMYSHMSSLPHRRFFVFILLNPRANVYLTSFCSTHNSHSVLRVLFSMMQVLLHIRYPSAPQTNSPLTLCTQSGSELIGQRLNDHVLQMLLSYRRYLNCPPQQCPSLPLHDPHNWKNLIKYTRTIEQLFFSKFPSISIWCRPLCYRHGNIRSKDCSELMPILAETVHRNQPAVFLDTSLKSNRDLGDVGLLLQ